MKLCERTTGDFWIRAKFQIWLAEHWSLCHLLARNVADNRYTKEFFARNVAEVGRNSPSAILRAIFRATNSGVDKRCNLAIARNATPCILALSLIECQITICIWSWTSNKIFFSRKGIWTVGDTWNSISDRQNLSQILIEPITIWPVTLLDSAAPNIFKFCVFVYIAGIYILFSFTNEKGELTILATKQSLLASYPTRKASFLTTDYMGQNDFADISTQSKLFGIPLFFVSQFHWFSLQCSKFALLNAPH